MMIPCASAKEVICRLIFIEGRGPLKQELVCCLRTSRALRAPREQSWRETWAHLTPGTQMSEGPTEADDRAVPGDWESQCLCQAVLSMGITAGSW
jgi:IS30 family transposase